MKSTAYTVVGVSVNFLDGNRLLSPSLFEGCIPSEATKSKPSAEVGDGRMVLQFLQL
jgi:hypothetical protein